MDDVIAAVLESCRRHWQINLAAAIDGRDPEGVHQVRVGLRRFRSALSLFRQFIPETQRAWLNAEAKWIASQLGPVRDLDVFLADLEDRTRRDNESATALSRAARRIYERARAEAVAALKSTRMRRFGARLEAWLEGRGWHAGDVENSSVEAFARERLNKRLRKMRGVAARAEELSVPERHELRIAVKKLRYGLEFLGSALPEKRVQRAGALLKRLQDSLGHLNDLDVAERTIAVAASEASPIERRRMREAAEMLKTMHRKAALKAEPETERLCHKLVRLPPL